MSNKVITQIGLTRRYSPYLMMMLTLIKDGNNIFSTKHGEQFLRNIIRKPLKERLNILAYGNQDKLSFLLDNEFIDSASVDGNMFLFQDKILRAKASIYEAIRDLGKDNLSQILDELILSFEILGFQPLHAQQRSVGNLITI
ncbi:MAG: hypothetical protein KKD63_03695 [Proteobacteria bacterium]|nr:hypothetical protein [Desulfobulbaceae bacterium]MBU4151963.1 hypothetical protein [Pseudomonadota bacterium]